jgi:acyl-CoA hydrolase
VFTDSKLEATSVIRKFQITTAASKRHSRNDMNRRHIILASLFAAILPACGKKTAYSPVPPGSLVLAFGDSATFGTGAGSGEDWPTRLGALTGWQMINAGVPGDTAQAGKGRIEPLLSEHAPALVIIEIGGNDFLRRRSAALVKEDLRHLIRVSKATGAQVVLVAVPELSLLAVVAGKPGDSPIYQALGEEEGIPVIADIFSNVLAKPELCADKIHPNARGYEVMATGMFEELRRFGFAG